MVLLLIYFKYQRKFTQQNKILIEELNKKMNLIDSHNQSFINAMERLVQYIEQSSQNQSQIFQSLSKNDIQKIIHNFNNENTQLRKLSLKMIALLLSDNKEIKINFCNKMNIDLIPGKICLNFNNQRSNYLTPDKTVELLKLLKQPIKKEDNLFLLWIINLRKIPLTIDFVPTSAINYVDPLDLIVGFILPETNDSKKTFKLFSLFQNVNTCVPRLNRNQDFSVKPSTQRFSSTSSDASKRFSRTNNTKMSLKQHSTRNSVSKVNDQNIYSQNNGAKQNSMRFSQYVKTNSIYTPQKQKSQYARSTQNSINQFKSIRKMHEIDSINTIKNERCQKQKLIYQPIINNTNIFISSQIKNVQIKGDQVRINHNQANSKAQQNAHYQKQSVQKYKNLMEYAKFDPNKISYIPINHKAHNALINKTPSAQNSQIIITPIKKYQRVTAKNSEILKINFGVNDSSNLSSKDKSYDFNKYKQFINRVSSNANKSKEGSIQNQHAAISS